MLIAETLARADVLLAIVSLAALALPEARRCGVFALAFTTSIAAIVLLLR